MVGNRPLEAGRNDAAGHDPHPHPRHQHTALGGAQLHQFAIESLEQQVNRGEAKRYKKAANGCDGRH